MGTQRLQCLLFKIQQMKEIICKNIHLIDDFGPQFHCLLGIYAAYFREYEDAKKQLTLAAQVRSNSRLNRGGSDNCRPRFDGIQLLEFEPCLSVCIETTRVLRYNRQDNSLLLRQKHPCIASVCEHPEYLSAE